MTEMSREELDRQVAHLRKRGLTERAIAKQLGICPSNVHYTLQRLAGNPRSQAHRRKPMTNDSVRDTAGALVQISRYGGEVRLRRQSVTDPTDWVELRLPASSAADVGQRLIELASAVPGGGGDGARRADAGPERAYEIWRARQIRLFGEGAD